MKKVAEARIEWLSAEQRGRTAPPSSGEYTTVVRFEDEPSDGPGVVWSLVVGLSMVTEGSTEAIAPVWLLAHDKADAPTDWNIEF
jgi:hypothetical protein